MAIFDSLDETTDNAISRSEAFLKSSEAYYELKLFQMLSTSLTLLVKFCIVGALVLIALIFAAISLAIKFSDILNSSTLGYLSTAGIFLILALIAFGLRKPIENTIVKKLSAKINK